ncbi:Beta-ketoacyl synthase [Isosphaera pallida ATCC 43644]|uniref:Beta-ketoacyl synthase n=1 Tax=Isosphaera pallida (strain ATCC 43644 / DSM 9630 / IS1B) TaxID=575540 RepID=E8QZI4_ISOPI|nr:beta-ketoacyl synthase N-terminal-like domain-containing protein [Isosphaera pallida]ADV61111.1 Beta-ketoacyl synthase [Isosphaera pallida ATCC 43644]
MRDVERRVVVTGQGLISPFGWDRVAAHHAFVEGRTGIAPIRSFAVEGLPTNCGGEIAEFTEKAGKAMMPPKLARAYGKSLKYMARDIQLAVVAAALAVSDAGLAEGGVDPTRFGIDLGAGLISTELDELTPAIQTAYAAGNGAFDFAAWGTQSIPLIQPIWLLRYLPNMLACHISIFMDCQGPSNTVTQGEAAAALAIGEAARLIATDRADVMISGAADSKIHPLSLVRMTMLGQLSTWPGDPTEGCRPFDRAACGWLPGEGAGILVLEERDHALKRGARIDAEVVGFGSGCDAVPGGLGTEGRGVEVAVAAALRDAGLQPDQLGLVIAHGSGVPAWDQAEVRGLTRALDGARVPVTGLKGHVGTSASASGSIETIIGLQSLIEGTAPAIRNCVEPITDQLDLIVGAPRPLPPNRPHVLKVGFTRLGQASALILKAQTTAA